MSAGGGEEGTYGVRLGFERNSIRRSNGERRTRIHPVAPVESHELCIVHAWPAIVASVLGRGILHLRSVVRLDGRAHLVPRAVLSLLLSTVVVGDVVSEWVVPKVGQRLVHGGSGREDSDPVEVDGSVGGELGRSLGGRPFEGRYHARRQIGSHVGRYLC
jgi:hypothetical protein